jgi:ATP-binding cassette, subfamily B, bacterial HlyB/CyaB
MLGFCSPTEGQICLDGVDIQHLSANELRGALGAVPQDTVLFSGTVFENIVMANALADFEHVVQVCKLAEIHDTIEALPKGYQTKLGEHGADLSGGQRQRLSIARALLMRPKINRPKILLFDEPTSARSSDSIGWAGGCSEGRPMNIFERLARDFKEQS